MRYLPHAIRLPLGALLFGAACYVEPVPKPEDCDERFSSQAVGTWELSAHGRRYECKDTDYNGDLTIEMRPFLVEGTALESDGSEVVPATDSEADAFVERIRHVRYRLEAERSADFKFEGSSNTCSVEFTIREELRGRDYHEYEFTGYVTSAGYIEGTFEGKGPTDCLSEGNFEIVVD